ncbi:hypothetical protein LXL04_010675 [Taraxacum kok-saghyz]
MRVYVTLAGRASPGESRQCGSGYGFSEGKESEKERWRCSNRGSMIGVVIKNFGILELPYVFGGKIILRMKEVMTCGIWLTLAYPYTCKWAMIIRLVGMGWNVMVDVIRHVIRHIGSPPMTSTMTTMVEMVSKLIVVYNIIVILQTFVVVVVLIHRELVIRNIGKRVDGWDTGCDTHREARILHVPWIVEDVRRQILMKSIVDVVVMDVHTPMPIFIRPHWIQYGSGISRNIRTYVSALMFDHHVMHYDHCVHDVPQIVQVIWTCRMLKYVPL